MKRRSEDKRMQAVLEVWAGRRTAKAAAGMLGISRKTYYQWEARALEAMRLALKQGQPGRPAKKIDPRNTELVEQNRQLQEELLILQQRERIRSLLAESTTTAQKKSGDRYRD